ncbi:MFS transporter [Bryobacterales bacterium F-183]|nr:MFS transporter [Bryobacterales bacterium F-183]
MTVDAYAGLLKRNRNFRLVWTSQLISEIGDWFYTVAVMSYVIHETGSATSMALVFVMQVLPQVLCSPLAGVINDRLSRRSIMIGTDWCRCAIVATMLLVVHAGALPLLYILLFLETVMWALFEPARTAAIPNITQGEETAIANALSSATWAVAFALGSGLGGLVQAYLGRDSVFIINAASFAASALLISATRFVEPHLQGLPPFRLRDLFSFTPILDGFRYARQSPERFRTMFVKAGFGLLGVNWIALPLLGEREFPIKLPGVAPADEGTLGMSFLLSSRGVGAIIGALAGSAYAGIIPARLKRNIALGFLAGAIGYMTLSKAPNFYVAALCVMLAHAGGSAGWSSSTTLLQRITEDKFRGRVFSSEYAMSMLILAVVAFATGTAVDAGVPVRTVSAIAGAAALIPAIWWTIASRAFSSGTDR